MARQSLIRAVGYALACPRRFVRVMGKLKHTLPMCLTALAIAAQAQDLRHVTEPVIPPSCAVLTAHSTGPNDAAPDTKLIQDALDRCEAGHSVELKSDGAANSFLSGPLQLRAGVTLLVDANAMLY